MSQRGTVQRVRNTSLGLEQGTEEARKPVRARGMALGRTAVGGAGDVGAGTEAEAGAWQLPRWRRVQRAWTPVVLQHRRPALKKWGQQGEPNLSKDRRLAGTKHGGDNS